MVWWLAQSTSPPADTIVRITRDSESASGSPSKESGKIGPNPAITLLLMSKRPATVRSKNSFNRKKLKQAQGGAGPSEGKEKRAQSCDPTASIHFHVDRLIS